MATRHESKDPLKDAIAKVTKDNIEWITGLRIAKHFANIESLFVGFEGRDKKDQDFQLHVDYDPIKNRHVNVMVNGSEKHEYCGKDFTWHEQVLNNMNGGASYNVPRNDRNEWQTVGQEKNPEYIEGMNRFLRRFV